MKMNIISLICLLWITGCTPDTKTSSVESSDEITEVAPSRKTVAKEIKSEKVIVQESKPTDSKPEAIKSEPKVDVVDKEKEEKTPVVSEPKKEIKKPAVKPDVAKKKVVPPPPPPPPSKPEIFFPDTLFNYGFINEGDTIKHSFRFINDGKVDLEILDVQVSCGCTVPKWSLEPIGPGRLSKIEVTFLSKGKIGSQLATIDVLTNAKNPRQTLYLKGVVR